MEKCWSWDFTVGGGDHLDPPKLLSKSTWLIGKIDFFFLSWTQKPSKKSSGQRTAPRIRSALRIKSSGQSDPQGRDQKSSGQKKILRAENENLKKPQKLDLEKIWGEKTMKLFFSFRFVVVCPCYLTLLPRLSREMATFFRSETGIGASWTRVCPCALRNLLLLKSAFFWSHLFSCFPLSLWLCDRIFFRPYQSFWASATFFYPPPSDFSDWATTLWVRSRARFSWPHHHHAFNFKIGTDSYPFNPPPHHHHHSYPLSPQTHHHYFWCPTMTARK